MNVQELRERIGAARRVILEPARVAAEAAKQEIMREVLGAELVGTVTGFRLGDYELGAVTCDIYGNWYAREWPATLPPLDRLEALTVAVLYLYDSDGTHYPLRPAAGFLIGLVERFDKEIDTAYAAELLRVGRLYCERNSGYPRWIRAEGKRTRTAAQTTQEPPQ